VLNRPPPTHLQCQGYTPDPLPEIRCVNTGTHWERWGHCNCSDKHDDVCEKAIDVWTCAGPCIFDEAT
jgi:hypothetical protein